MASDVQIRRLLERAGVDRVNKPRLTPHHATKKAVVVAKDGDRVRLIRFGAQGYGHNYSASARRSFKARHAKNIAKGKMSAAYWADRFLWTKGGHTKMPPKKKTKRNPRKTKRNPRKTKSAAWNDVETNMGMSSDYKDVPFTASVSPYRGGHYWDVHFRAPRGGNYALSEGTTSSKAPAAHERGPRSFARAKSEAARALRRAKQQYAGPIPSSSKLKLYDHVNVAGSSAGEPSLSGVVLGRARGGGLLVQLSPRRGHPGGWLRMSASELEKTPKRTGGKKTSKKKLKRKRNPTTKKRSKKTPARRSSSLSSTKIRRNFWKLNEDLI